MANIVVVGAQWGDESKGKIVDYLTRYTGMVVRYGGGNNAGHSVQVGPEEYKFHLVPSGILHPDVLCVISDGVVIDPAVLVQELKELLARGVSLENLKISPAAHLILPYHCLLDKLEEQTRGTDRIGTTGRGIGPAYADKALRIGIRMGEFIDPERFAARLRAVGAWKNLLLTRLYAAEPLDLEAVLAEYAEYACLLSRYVCDTSVLIHREATAGNGVLFEGAQGALLDIDQGTYPFVTSSHPVAGGACIGTGIGPTEIDAVIGCVKAYTTRVGAGIFPTELLDSTGDYIRARGNEYGTTTGRPRRCGWLDAVVLRYAARINGLSCLALSHLDVLAGLDSVQICVGYRDGSGTVLDDLPPDLAQRSDLQPIYEHLPGWSEEVARAHTPEQLPREALQYTRRIEDLTGIPVATISVGRDRAQTLVQDGVLAAWLPS